MARVQAILCAVAVAVAVARPVTADDPALPGGAPMAFVQADPTGFGTSSTWLSTLLRTLDAAGVVRAEDRPVADGLLAATLLGSYPHTIALLDLKAHRFEAGKFEIDHLQMIVSIDCRARFAEFRQALQTILSHYGSPEDRHQEVIELPGARQGVRYRLASWPGWMAVEWASDGKAFVLGVGQGSLQRWFSDGAPVQQHDASVAALTAAIADMPAGTAAHPFMLRCYVDLDRLRASTPTLFATGRLTPLLQAFGLHEKNQLLLAARWKETFAVLAGAASKDGRIAAAPLTLDHWPEDLGVPMPPGRFHLVAPMDGADAARRLVQIVRVCRKAEHMPRYDRWVAQHFGPRLERLTEHVARYRPVLMMSDHPKAWLPVPGTATVYVALKQEAAAQPAADELQTLLGPALHVPADPPDAVSILTDPATGVQWLDSPMRGLFKSPAWAWCEQVLVVSYSPLAVLSNRQWLMQEPPETQEARKPQKTQEPKISAR